MFEYMNALTNQVIHFTCLRFRFSLVTPYGVADVALRARPAGKA
jgi:hypothetical protein